MENPFDDLRPYYDREVPAAMARIAASPLLPAMQQYVFPEQTPDTFRQLLLDIRTVDEFQIRVMYHFNKAVIRNSIDRLTYSGLDHLDPSRSYLFVSNHRDIVLDSSLMQNIFYSNGFRTTQITFGSNLMSSQLIVDIGKSNKMFTVFRGGNMRDFYKNSLHLSEYIRHTIARQGESIWIAQRNGRTKDGNDATDQGIVKMFGMSDAADPVRSIEALHIVPMAVSYGIEPCDFLKVRERYLARDGQPYVKQKDEDLNSILTGITQPKGHVHFHFCKPICANELSALFAGHPNEFHRRVAALIDRRIHAGYLLQTNHYIAHDLRSGTDTYASHYTADDKRCFIERCDRLWHEVDGDRDILLAFFLGIYANAVDNRIGLDADLQRGDSESRANLLL